MVHTDQVVHTEVVHTDQVVHTMVHTEVVHSEVVHTDQVVHTEAVHPVSAHTIRYTAVSCRP